MKKKNVLKVYAAVLCMVSVVLMPGCAKKGIGEEKAKEIAFADAQTDEKKKLPDFRFPEKKRMGSPSMKFIL